MHWKTLLAYMTGTVDQELLLRHESLATEHRILRHQFKGCVHLVVKSSRRDPLEIVKPCPRLWSSIPSIM